VFIETKAIRLHRAIDAAPFASNFENVRDLAGFLKNSKSVVGLTNSDSKKEAKEG
jgi:hypothetical protein